MKDPSRIARGLLATFAIAGLLASIPAGLAMADESREADVTVPQSITVTGDGRYRAIELAKYTHAVTDGEHVTGLTVRTVDEVRDPIVKAAKAAVPGKATGSDFEADPMTWVANTLTDSQSSPYAGELRDFVTALASGDLPQGRTAAASDGTAVFDGLEAGIYLITDISTGGASIPMLTGTRINGMDTVGQTLGRVAAKKADVDAPHKTAIKDGVESTALSAAIGDVITYRLTATVPSTVGYDHYYLALRDTLSAGLTFEKLSTVTMDGKPLDATLYHESAAGNTLTVLFGDENGDIKGRIKDGAKLAVAYTAKVNVNATTGAQGNPNNVALDHSHNPSDWTRHGTVPGDGSVIVYTGGFTLHKTDADGKTLDGATFAITRRGDDTPLKFTLKDGEYRYDPDDGTITDLPAGTLKVGGLNGDYTVRETRSPYAHAILPTFDVTVSSSKDGSAADVSRDLLYGLVSVTGTDIRVMNVNAITSLPATGLAGMGLIVLPALLLLAAGFLMTRRTRIAR